MRISKWLFGTPRFVRFDDSFALTRSSLAVSLQTAIEKQQQTGRQVWLVTHFPETFFEMQEFLAESNLDYQIVDQAIDRHTVLSSLSAPRDQIQLSLAELLNPAESLALDYNEQLPVSMIVVERHPHLPHDFRLEEFARKLPCPVQFGYYLSIEDTVVQRVVSTQMLEIFRLLGMQEHDLISSNMLTRRMEKILRQEVRIFRTDHRAESASQWYQINRQQNAAASSGSANSAKPKSRS